MKETAIFVRTMVSISLLWVTMGWLCSPDVEKRTPIEFWRRSCLEDSEGRIILKWMSDLRGCELDRNSTEFSAVPTPIL
jgi:hypothetical protein